MGQDYTNIIVVPFVCFAITNKITLHHGIIFSHLIIELVCLKLTSVGHLSKHVLGAVISDREVKKTHRPMNGPVITISHMRQSKYQSGGDEHANCPITKQSRGQHCQR